MLDMGFKDLLKIMIAKEGSDLFLTADAPPSIKAFGHMVPLGSQILPAGTVEKIAAQLMTPDQARAFEKDPELNIALSEPDIGRFRINIFKQRGQLAMVARHIKTDIPSCDQLNLPDTLKIW
jgi:twitching motility protein PilU